MTTSIFIRSFRTDREWLSYCLRSLERFAKGFEEIVVVIPKEDSIHFDKFDFRGARPIYVHALNVHPYVGQQFDKLNADTYARGEWIMFIDSDCFVTRTLYRQEFINFTGNKEVLPYEHTYGPLNKAIQLIRLWESVGDAKCWKEPTDKVLGFDTPWETMAAMPLVYHRDSFPMLREHIQKVNNMSLATYLLGLSGATFSEFNVLGNFCLRYLPYRYDWRLANSETDGFCRTIVQRYSHGDLKQYVEEYERILAQ